MNDIAIEAEGLSKHYLIPAEEGQGRYRTLRDSLAHGAKRFMSRVGGQGARSQSFREFWALKDISFKVARNERIGIIGANGAGKSTLLKVLSRVVAPSNGRARIAGRVASLLEVGTGFHPELTGAENIQLNAALLGMTKGELARVYDDIVAFSGVSSHIDVPVKRYSSGMYTRLAFAVAAHVEPDILIVDEVLAVGDAAFQKKCIDRMQSMQQEDRTIVFVSHNMALVSALCTRAMVLHQGQVHVPLTSVADAISSYNALTREHGDGDLSRRNDRQGLGDVRFDELMIGATPDSVDPSIMSGQPLHIRFKLHGKPETEFSVGVAITNEWAHTVAYFGSENSGRIMRTDAEGRAWATLRIPSFRFAAGTYSLNVAAYGRAGVMQDWLQSAGWFRCEFGDLYGNGSLTPPGHFCALPEHSWVQNG